MTDLPALAERIHGILVRAKIGFTPSQDGLEFFVPIRDGTAAVMVRPGSFGDEPLVLFQSPVLQGVRFEEAGARALAPSTCATAACWWAGCRTTRRTA